MKNKILSLLGVFAVLTANPVWTQEKNSAKYDLGEVIVTATKTEQYQAQVGSSSTVITAEDIDKLKKRTVGELLGDVPGVSVTQNGPLGGTVSVYLRGSNTGHTLVLIDGVEVKDPMQMYGGFFDFAHLTTDNIERIEVIRGPQSTLYGSDAIGGVINIITKKGKGKPKFEVSCEGGSYHTFKESTAVRGGTKNTNYSFSLSHLDSTGISKAHGGNEKDGYENTTASSSLAWKLFEDSELIFIGRYTDAQTDLDDGAYDDDINHTAWWKNIMGKAAFNQAINSIWDHKFSFSSSQTLRKLSDEPDRVDPADNTHNWYWGGINKLEWQHNVYPVDWNTLTGGFEYKEERGWKDGRNASDRIDRKTTATQSYYLQNQLRMGESLYVTPGVRIDEHEFSGIETTEKISALYFIPQTDTRIKTNWGTGFKAPSVFQLYSQYGNLGLEEEESKGGDLGLEQNFLTDRLSLGLVYFRNDFKNLIVYSSGIYQNVARAKTEGEELELTLKPQDNLTLGANYTYTKTKDKSNGRELTRRPKKQAAFNLNWLFSEKGNINLTVSYIGHSWDDSANALRLKSYTNVDLNTSYDLTRRFQIFARIENLLDKNYQQIRGYATPGLSFYAGSNLIF